MTNNRSLWPMTLQFDWLITLLDIKTYWSDWLSLHMSNIPGCKSKDLEKYRTESLMELKQFKLICWNYDFMHWMTHNTYAILFSQNDILNAFNKWFEKSFLNIALHVYENNLSYQNEFLKLHRQLLELTYEMHIGNDLL